MGRLTFRYYPHPLSTEEAEIEKKIFKYSLVIPIIFLIIIWMIKIVEIILGEQYIELGVLPRNLSGLIGILTSPLIHADFNHLIANSSSFIVLSTALFFFYRKVALTIFVLNYFMSGLFLWLGGREVIHIGASGIIYGMAAFLLFSGILRKDLRLLTISLIVVFLYGSMLWGLFPIEPGISWDGHLMGAVSGTILSLLYYKQGPPSMIQDEIETETEEEESDENEYWKVEEGEDERRDGKQE
jgi:membrane associated rhomboid family serine protease